MKVACTPLEIIRPQYFPSTRHDQLFTRNCRCDKFLVRESYRIIDHFLTLFNLRMRQTKVNTMVRKLQTSKLQGLFKDNLKFSRTKICSINRNCWTLFWTSIISFLQFFTSSVMVDFAQWRFAKVQQSLGMTWSCVWGTEIAFEIKKQKQNIVHARGSYTEDVPNFPRRTILIAQKMVHGVNN